MSVSPTLMQSATQEQGQKAKPHGNAETRLKEILADLKKAGLSPSELKTFKREAAQLTESAIEAAARHYGLPPDAVLAFYKENKERVHYFVGEGAAVLYRAKQRRGA